MTAGRDQQNLERSRRGFDDLLDLRTQEVAAIRYPARVIAVPYSIDGFGPRKRIMGENTY